MRVRESIRHVLVLTDSPAEFGPNEVEVARAFADAAGAGLARLQLAGEHAALAARQAALARAARTLNESLELNRVLVRICEEASSILGSDYANVFLGNATDGLRFEATYGLSPDVIGEQVEAGEGLVGKCVERDEPMLTNDYQALARQVRIPVFAKVRSSLAVPLHWDGETRGAIAVGYFEPVLVTREDLDLLTDTCDNILGRSFCALGDGATSCIASSLKYFRDDYVALLPAEEQGRLGRSLRLEPVGAAS